MTVAVAVRKNGRTVFAADSLVNFGGQRFPPSNCQFHKLHRVGNSVLAWAGWSLYAELLTAHLGSNPPPVLDSEKEVFAFFVGFWRAMRQEYTLLRPPSDSDDHPFADLNSVFLLANRTGIYRIASDMDVTKFEQYDAIGSGSKYALGALRVLYARLDEPVDIARQAVQVGIDSDVYCGGPIDVISLENGVVGEVRRSDGAGHEIR